MDMMARAALSRASEALRVAANIAHNDGAADDDYFRSLIESLVHGGGLPRAVRDDEERLEASGFVKERGGVAIPLHRLFGRAFRDLTSDTGTGTGKGGYLIGTAVPQVLPELGIVPQVVRAGATMLTGLKADTRIGFIDQGATVTWLTDETTEASESTPSFGGVTLRPKTASTYIDISRLLRLQGALSIEGLSRAHLARVVARAVDAAALTGSGSSGQPTGITNTSGVASFAMGTNGAAITRAKLRSIIQEVTDANGIGAESLPAFMANSATALSCYATETSSGSGRYLFEPTSPTTGTLGGWGCFIDDSLPSTGAKGSGTSLSTLIFGDWRQLLIGQWGALELLANPYTPGGNAGITRLHVYLSIDVGIAHPGAFCVSSDITTP